MSGNFFLRMLLVLLGVIGMARAGQFVGSSGIWVWSTVKILSNQTDQTALVSQMNRMNLSDVFLYMDSSYYSKYESSIKDFNSFMNSSGVRVWGLEGGRVYFSDCLGPAGLYAAVNAMIAFNNRTQNSTQKFFGFQTDIEPQDQTSIPPCPSNFHNGKNDSSLSPSEATDRQNLMLDWVQIHIQIKNLLLPMNLPLAAALVQWTDNYYGEPVHCTINSVKKCVFEYLQPYIDRIDVMSYQTNPTKNYGRIQGELNFAEGANPQPKIFASEEVDEGAGLNVSYFDSPPLNHQFIVISNMTTIKNLALNFTCFGGVNLHEWSGWKLLPP